MWVGDRLFKVSERKEFFFHSSLPEWKVTSQLSNICKFIQVWEKKKKKAHPKDYVRCTKPQIPWGLFIFKLRKQSIWWLPERGQCVFVLITSNTVSHCLKNNFLSRNCFDWALASNELLLFNKVVLITINPVTDCEPLPFDNLLGFLDFCEASKLSHIPL